MLNDQYDKTVSNIAAKLVFLVRSTAIFSTGLDGFSQGPIRSAVSRLSQIIYLLCLKL